MSGKTGIVAGFLAFVLFVSAVTAPVGSGHKAVSGVAVVAPDSLRTDLETGLAIDDQLMLVKSHCMACHSAQLIRQSHFTRQKWVERIRWMQRTQNLWELGASEPAILAYLTKHYGPVEYPFDGRREPLKNAKWYTLSP